MSVSSKTCCGSYITVNIATRPKVNSSNHHETQPKIIPKKLVLRSQNKTGISNLRMLGSKSVSNKIISKPIFSLAY